MLLSLKNVPKWLPLFGVALNPNLLEYKLHEDLVLSSESA